MNGEELQAELEGAEEVGPGAVAAVFATMIAGVLFIFAMGWFARGWWG